ncbi:hypothetical protein SKAU_G00317010 [Synaphobranchus kaupii]|uniref:Uncharacterized protein n=1 Tax=Synaphobranchus kaupii TaxID=118154 RepID=A0A9Q1ESX0_SYNKA|nr:hypothetical protein SKAU_G00317010 [Synaphobranchus kaupii]
MSWSTCASPGPSAHRTAHSRTTELSAVTQRALDTSDILSWPGSHHCSALPDCGSSPIPGSFSADGRSQSRPNGNRVNGGFRGETCAGYKAGQGSRHTARLPPRRSEAALQLRSDCFCSYHGDDLFEPDRTNIIKDVPPRGRRRRYHM